MSGTIFAGNFIKLLKSNLQFFNGVEILTGSGAPAVGSEPAGSLYLDESGGHVWTRQAASWLQVDGAQWAISGSNIYYSTGVVGIGTAQVAYTLGGQQQNPVFIASQSASAWTSALFDTAHSDNFVLINNPSQTTQISSWATYGMRVGVRHSGSGEGSIYFTTGNDTVGMKLSNSGSLGIGNAFNPGSVPASILSVAGNASIGSGYASSSAAPANGLIVEGSVGIGTTAPGYHLDVNSGAAPLATRLIGSDADGPVIRFENTSGAGGRTYHVGSTNAVSAAGNGFSIYDLTAGKPCLLINPSGNVGIGTTSPAFALDVAGKFQVDSNGNIEKIKSVPYTWPAAQASQAGQVLSNNGSGNLSWQTPSVSPIRNYITAPDSNDGNWGLAGSSLALSTVTGVSSMRPNTVNTSLALTPTAASSTTVFRRFTLDQVDLNQLLTIKFSYRKIESIIYNAYSLLLWSYSDGTYTGSRTRLHLTTDNSYGIPFGTGNTILASSVDTEVLASTFIQPPTPYLQLEFAFNGLYNAFAITPDRLVLNDLTVSPNNYGTSNNTYLETFDSPTFTGAGITAAAYVQYVRVGNLVHMTWAGQSSPLGTGNGASNTLSSIANYLPASMRPGSLFGAVTTVQGSVSMTGGIGTVSVNVNGTIQFTAPANISGSFNIPPFTFSWYV